MLDPYTVTDADPVPARFCPRIMLSPAMSTDHACVTLPPRAPAVITTRHVPRAPCVFRHLTDVSDSHAVASQPVCATRALPELLPRPKLDPCTVTDADPVPARFCPRIMLSPAMSADHARVTLPPRAPAVITTSRVPRAPCVTTHLTDVSDSHAVASQPVCATRVINVKLTRPMLVPCTVTDADPVPARFCPRILLSPTTSADHACVTLPPHAPAVITNRHVPWAPFIDTLLTDVSDSQAVASQPVCAARALVVWLARPMLDPCTVTDADPVPARFCPRVLLSPAMSADHACVTLPPRAPAVITIPRVPRAPCVTKHLTEVSDSHAVASSPVCAARTLPV
jgi:hypothetical protein